MAPCFCLSKHSGLKGENETESFINFKHRIKKKFVGLMALKECILVDALMDKPNSITTMLSSAVRISEPKCI